MSWREAVDWEEMHYQITVDPDDGELLSNLYRWVSRDVDVMGNCRLELAQSEPVNGHMGGVLDVINMVATHTIAVSGLIIAIDTWRRTLASQGADPAVTIERGETKITVTSADPNTVRALVAKLTDDSNDLD